MKSLPSVSIPAPDQFQNLVSATRCDCSDYYVRRDEGRGRGERSRTMGLFGIDRRRETAQDTTEAHVERVRQFRVKDRELGERTSGIKPFFRYVTPWQDRERSFSEGGRRGG